MRYFVTGHGQFPDDMLRYDRAIKVRQANVAGFPGWIIESEVEPTVDRWQSFLWTAMPMLRHGDKWEVKFAGKWEPLVS